MIQSHAEYGRWESTEAGEGSRKKVGETMQLETSGTDRRQGMRLGDTGEQKAKYWRKSSQLRINCCKIRKFTSSPLLGMSLAPLLGWDNDEEGLWCWEADELVSLAHILEQMLVVTLIPPFYAVRSDFTHFWTYTKKPIKFALFEGRSLFQPKGREYLWFVKITSVFAPQLPLWLCSMRHQHDVSFYLCHSTEELYQKWQISDVLSKCIALLAFSNGFHSCINFKEMRINNKSCLKYRAQVHRLWVMESKTDKILLGLTQSSQERRSSNNESVESYGFSW